jgi:hypothetical protein
MNAVTVAIQFYCLGLAKVENLQAFRKPKTQEDEIPHHIVQYLIFSKIGYL